MGCLSRLAAVSCCIELCCKTCDLDYAQLQKHAHTHTITHTAICQVESYMNDIIAKMRSELRGVLKSSVAAYPGSPRDKWLFEWPSQVILVVNQIFWCQEVEQVSCGARRAAVAGAVQHPL